MTKLIKHGLLQLMLEKIFDSCKHVHEAISKRNLSNVSSIEEEDFYMKTNFSHFLCHITVINILVILAIDFHYEK